MPVYEYKCESCGEVFELIQKFSDEPLKVHEKCGGSVHRLLSAPALQFKGTGWYITDYAKGSSGSSPSHKSDSGHSKEGGSSNGDGNSSSKAAPPAATESKPAASADKKA
ncbi:MAG TPA: FmdB family zinc ribbon protein [Bryobacteraceae bacterium]|jgi:putative FmdB family regulatory protein|nr:FmdB family zinc ribbon protein [Bryobacteraceae bacterium]